MRHGVILTLVCGLCAGACGCIAVVKDGGGGGESRPKPVAATPMPERGTVEPITALDRKPEGDHERISAEVRYANDTGRTLKAVVIWCRALDAGGYELASQQVTLMSNDVGPMATGFKAKRAVSFAQPPGTVASVACEVTSAQ